MGIKIAHILSYPYHGGTQEYAFNLAYIQNQLGNEAHIIASGILSKNDKINIVNIKPFVTIFRNPISFGLANKVFQGDYDVIHVHLPFPITGDLVILKNYVEKTHKKKLFISYHFDIDLESSLGKAMAYFYNNVILKRIINYSDGIFVSSKRFASTSPILKHFNGKIIIKPIGVNTKQFIPSKSHYPQVLFVGRVIPEKGIHYVIKALKYVDDRLKLKIIGKIVDLNYSTFLHDLIKREKLNDRVLITGRVSTDELRSSYQEAQMVVLPSTTRLESFGITLLEAMASAKPIIASDIIPGAVELIKESGSGLLVPPRDPQSLANAITYLLGPKGKEMGENGRTYVIKNCDWKIIGEEITKEYFNG